MTSKQDLLQKNKYERKQAESTSSYTYNKTKDSKHYGSSSKLPQNDTYESVCAPEDTEERNQAAQRNSQAMLMNQAAGNRLLKRVVSAPVGIEMPKGKSSSLHGLLYSLATTSQNHFYPLHRMPL